MNPKNILQLTLHLNTIQGAADTMATLLQRGFLVPVSGAVSIVDLLTSLPGFDAGYIKDRVQTIFVNGLAEDNTARQLTAGDTLALSAAMPGLAGAIFRKGGQHASLRTRPLTAPAHKADQSGFITLKLFNMVATETGPQLLKDGIPIKGTVLARFLDRQGARILPIIDRADVESKPEQPARLAEIVKNQEKVFLKIYA
jgi:hypothetical protein